MKDFMDGLKKGFPICLGYIPVSFTFGIMVVSNGMPVWMALFISMTNLTSSGQFAGTNLILAGAGYFEITLATFIINIRYMLMSLSLSQRLADNVKTIHKMIFSFGITDETFAVASAEDKQITSAYMYGLVCSPYWGWALGTLLGAVASNLLPDSLGGAMGIALYAMFIAIIIPPAKKSSHITVIILISVVTTCFMKYLPVISKISPGFRITIATLTGAGIGAFLFPKDEEGGEADAANE